jgi:hypothetical protein
MLEVKKFSIFSQYSIIINYYWICELHYLLMQDLHKSTNLIVNCEEIWAKYEKFIDH